MKIRRIEVKNYLSHAHSVLENVGDLFAIIGENQSGKSNVFYAVECALMGTPWAEEDMYTPKHAPDKRATSGFIRVDFDDGRTVLRSRNGATQTYELTYPNGEVKVYKGVRGMGSVLEEFTGFSKVYLDDDKGSPTNLQLVPLAEASLPFLIMGATPETTQKRLNKLVGGADIEAAKVLVKGSLTNSLSRYQLLTEQEEAAAKIVDGVAPLKPQLHALDTELEDIEAQYKRAGQEEQRYNALYELYETADSLFSTLDKFEHATSVLDEYRNDVAELNVEYAKFVKLQSEADMMKEVMALLYDIEELAEGADSLKVTIEEWSKKQSDEVVPCAKCGRRVVECG